MNYMEFIRFRVSQKWKTPEEKEIWYTKFSAARRRKRIYLFHKQKGKCDLCGAKMWLDNGKNKGYSNHKATLEHIIAQADGGTDSYRNLSVTCKLCNSTRGTIDYYKFKRFRRNKKKWERYLRFKEFRALRDRQKRSRIIIANADENIFILALAMHNSCVIKSWVDFLIIKSEEAKIKEELRKAIKLSSKDKKSKIFNHSHEAIDNNEKHDNVV